jgi:pimeloyl-ACP methyl ester carboxylesterase
VKRVKTLLLWVAVWRLLAPPLRPRFGVKQEHPWAVPARTYFVGDYEFAVRQVGPDDAPAVVMIHGLAGSSMAEWYKVAPVLANHFKVVMIDHRSHGFSRLDRGRFEIEDLADDTAAVMNQLGLEDATIVGYSMGGTIAQALAHRHPHLAARLVLVATMSHHPRAWRSARIVGTVIARGWERLTGTGTPEVRSAYLLAVRAVEREHASWLWEESHRRDPDAGAAASFALLRFDSRPWLPRLQLPALVVIPTRDQLVPKSWQYDLAGRLPAAAIEEIEGGRHEIPWSHAAQLAAAIVNFAAGDTIDRRPA